LTHGLVFGPDGNLYVANYGAGDVLRFNGATGVFIDTFIANGSGPTDGMLGGPTFLLFNEAAASTPEPATLGAVGFGLLGLLVWKRKLHSGRASNTPTRSAP